MIETFLKDLNATEKSIKTSQKEKTLKDADKLKVLPQTADNELKTMVSTLIRLVAEQDNQNALLVIKAIKKKVEG